MLAQGKPVLGICLGAQLLAHVLGAPIHRMERAEIGWYRLQPTEHGRADPVLSALGGECAGVPVASLSLRHSPTAPTHLATTPGCEQQAFRWGDNAYGFQFHLEMDEALIERWLATPAYREELAELGGDDGETAIREQTRAHITAMQANADAVFHGFLDLIGRPQRRYTLPSREFA